MLKRLRPTHTPDKLKEIYGSGYEYTSDDHWLRIGVTSSLVNWLAKRYHYTSFADLACGDGAIIGNVDHVFRDYHLGDFSSANLDKAFVTLDRPAKCYEGPIEETIKQIPEVDLFLCSETLEHIDDPLSLLLQIKDKAKCLVLSTPDNKYDDVNEEHYWAWDEDGIKELLIDAGFNGANKVKIDFVGEFYYNYQIWTAFPRG